MWRGITKAFDEFWYPTPELRAMRASLNTEPLWTRIRFGAGWTRAHWRWPVLWRRYAVILPCFALAVVLQAHGVDRHIAARQALNAKWDTMEPVVVFDQTSSKWVVQCHSGDPLSWVADYNMATAALKACQ